LSGLGRVRTVAEWAKLAGVSRWTMYRHLKRAGIIDEKLRRHRAWTRVSESTMRRLHPDWFEDARTMTERLEQLRELLDSAEELVAAIVDGPKPAASVARAEPPSETRLRAVPLAGARVA
jgi:hypothetical protein